MSQSGNASRVGSLMQPAPSEASIVSRHVRYASTPDLPWATARNEEANEHGKHTGRPSFDKTIEHDEWKRPAARASHRAYMREEDSAGAGADAGGHPSIELDNEDHRTMHLRKVALEQRRKRETQQGRDAERLAAARDAGHLRSSSKPETRGSTRGGGAPRGKEVLVQGVLASELGLVAPAASRRGPIIRPNSQDLERAGYLDTAFGYVSSKLHHEAEQTLEKRAVRERQYRVALQEQASQERQAKARSKTDATADRKLESELRRIELEKLIKIRDVKLRQLEADGVKQEHRALLAKMPL